METIGIISFIIILINIIVSNKGFSNYSFFHKYTFNVDKILIEKDFKRIITSGFLHVNWMHLIFNMISLYIFSKNLESYLGEFDFLIIYFTSLIGGNLFSLFIHRNDGEYTAVGASGAVCGIMFASIALFPGLEMGLLGIPYYFPAWLYGIAFVLFSVYGIKSKSDNIGHEAHLGGALAGLLVAIFMHPSSLVNNYLAIAIIVLPTVFFIYIIITRPEFLLIDNYFFQSQPNYHNIEERYNTEKKIKEEEIDRILEKIHQKGVGGLTKKEKEKLDSLSKLR